MERKEKKTKITVIGDIEIGQNIMKYFHNKAEITIIPKEEIDDIYKNSNQFFNVNNSIIEASIKLAIQNSDIIINTMEDFIINSNIIPYIQETKNHKKKTTIINVAPFPYGIDEQEIAKLHNINYETVPSFLLDYREKILINRLREVSK